MKRIVSKGIALTVLAVLATSGPAAAFTPVPIPTPRTGGAAAARVAHDHGTWSSKRDSKWINRWTAPAAIVAEPDASMTMLSGLLDGSLCALATYHLLKADLLTIRGLPETPSRPISNRRRRDRPPRHHQA